MQADRPQAMVCFPAMTMKPKHRASLTIASLSDIDRQMDLVVVSAARSPVSSRPAEAHSQAPKGFGQPRHSDREKI